MVKTHTASTPDRKRTTMAALCFMEETMLGRNAVAANRIKVEIWFSGVQNQIHGTS